jgi:tetratricopeptide (TPR) repeat protein/transcriptional regulator with XRE-family HTH domain
MGTEKLSGDKESHPTAAARLKQERDRHGWSQSELAERIGTTQVNVSRWETGQTSPGRYLRQQLAHVFEKSLEELGLVSVETVQEVQEGSPRERVIAASPFVTTQQVLWQLPYRQNPYFTGREDILTQVHAALNTMQSAVLTQTQAISGLGGVGKTQIAVEYAYRYRDEYSAVLWVDASSLDRFKDEFTSFAVLFNLPEQKEANQDVVISAVKRWLTIHTGWLLILDNIEDLDILDRFVPTISGGKVLLTTRQQALGTLAQSIPVDTMVEDEGILFLLRRSKMLPDMRSLSEVEQDVLKQAEDIVKELDGLPLALDQAGAYIEETQCGLSAYLNLYQRHKIRLLNRRGRLPAGHPEPVTTTWSLSFQRVKAANPAAEELLYLLAFLSPELIYEETLETGAEELGPTLGPIISDSLSFNDIIELLLHYSLIRRHTGEHFLSIHRLVQAVLRESMNEELAQTWAKRTVHAINQAFPEVEQSTWAVCHRCLPHALLCSLYIFEFELAFPEAARLLNKTAAYLIDHAQYNEAEPLLLQTLQILERVQSNILLDKAHTLNYLGSLYLIQGRYKEAELPLQESLHIRRQLLGPADPATAKSLAGVAQLYYEQGKYNDAEKLIKETLHIRQHKLDADHPDIAHSLGDLARLYIEQGKYTQAEDLYNQACALLEKAYGQQHLDVASLLNNLALVYRKKGEYKLAEKLYDQVLALQEEVWGDEHPDVAETLNNKARLFRAQGKYTDAEPLYKQALHIRENIFGLDHPKVAHSLYGLAKLYYSREIFQLAEENGRKALSIQKQHLGMKHPYVADTLVALAKIAQGQKRLGEAEQLNLEALTIQSEATGENHPRVALINNNLAEIYHLRGQYQEAQPRIQKAISIHEQSLGRDHPYMAYSLTNEAENAFGLGDHLKAEASYLRALAIREERLGPHHPRTVSSLRNLEKFYLARDNRLKAEEFKKKIQEANSTSTQDMSGLPDLESS